MMDVHAAMAIFASKAFLELRCLEIFGTHAHPQSSVQKGVLISQAGATVPRGCYQWKVMKTASKRKSRNMPKLCFDGYPMCAWRQIARLRSKRSS